VVRDAVVETANHPAVMAAVVVPAPAGWPVAAAGGGDMTDTFFEGN